MKITVLVGGRFHAFNLAEELEKKKYLSRLITSYPKFYVEKNFNINKKKIRSLFFKEILSRIPFFKKYLSDISIKYFEKFASKQINFDEVDILVGWSGFSLNSFQIASKFNCIKILERGSTHIEYQKEILREEYNLLGIKPNLPSKEIIDREIKEYQIADYIIVPSEFSKKTFIEKGFNKNKIIKVPYGVNISHFNTDKIEKKDNGIFRIIYVGSCSVRKGIIYLLKAFKDLNLEKSELIIVGNIENDLNPVISKYLGNKNINYFKSQKQTELNKFYNMSNVFVTCSVEEGLSMVQIQAMACGLPVICTPNSGGEEIVKDNYDGFILPIRRIDQLKNKISYLYNNRKICKQMGKNAKLKSQNFFTWEIYGKKVVENYLSILKKKNK